MCVVFLGLQLAFYTYFMEQNPNVHISLQSFQRFKPWFLKILKEFTSTLVATVIMYKWQNWKMDIIQCIVGYFTKIVTAFVMFIGQDVFSSMCCQHYCCEWC